MEEKKNWGGGMMCHSMMYASERRGSTSPYLNLSNHFKMTYGGHGHHKNFGQYALNGKYKPVRKEMK